MPVLPPLLATSLPWRKAICQDEKGSQLRPRGRSRGWAAGPSFNACHSPSPFCHLGSWRLPGGCRERLGWVLHRGWSDQGTATTRDQSPCSVLPWQVLSAALNGSDAPPPKIIFQWSGYQSFVDDLLAPRLCPPALLPRRTVSFLKGVLLLLAHFHDSSVSPGISPKAQNVLTPSDLSPFSPTHSILRNGREG